jgi:hypothetical protein
MFQSMYIDNPALMGIHQHDLALGYLFYRIFTTGAVGNRAKGGHADDMVNSTSRSLSLYTSRSILALKPLK